VLQKVELAPRTLEAYRHAVPEALLARVEAVANRLRGARLLHVNATPFGGGVSELLRSLVPMATALGIDCEWRVIHGDENFFRVTKTLHNDLQGAHIPLSSADRNLYYQTSVKNAEQLEGEYDFVVVHDPQPAALLALHGHRTGRWLWRCHIDTSNPDPSAWQFLSGFLAGYHAAVFTMRDFTPPDLPVERVAIIAPAVDPVSPKNLELGRKMAEGVVSWLGVDPARPLVTQVSRFDPWKDPLGVVRAYRQARQSVPGLQLALVGEMALDDPEGWEIYQKVAAEAAGDRDIHLLTNLTGVNNIEVNAFQRMSQVVIQKSTREGFGLVVSEALFKGVPVVAGATGGIRLQMADGAGGLLVNSIEECGEALVRLLTDPALAREASESGRRRASAYFLTPRLLIDDLELMEDLAGGPAPADERDPECGMALPARGGVRDADGRRFCSAFCRDRYAGTLPATA
jgi:trehalose synthase